MSMIARYKKKGGFLQLLNLIETCGPQKQDKFLKMIEEEDARWADAVRLKLLTMKRITSWDDNSVAELVVGLMDLTLATAIAGLDQSARDKIYKMMDHSRKRRIEDLIEEKKPNAAEISTAFMQIITETRKMITEGVLLIDKVDPDLIVSSEFEDSILNGIPIVKVSEEMGSKVTPPVDISAASSSGVATSSQKSEVEQLKKIVSQLTVENQKLKERVVVAENKLSQIKKIA